MALANPGLSSLITQSIGDGWLRDLNLLRGLESLAEDAAFQEEWRRVKLENKRTLTEVVRRTTGVTIDPHSLFDIQVKRIHEYKRQHLNVLHVVTLYNRLKNGLDGGTAPRTVIFGGKAAPGYFMAKLIIKLIHAVADVVNNDPKTSDKLKIVFLPDFNVKNAQRIYPAADLSEQISTAGKEASGTGNMKFSLNGALTIGTLDGANVEIREEVGPENFFQFGLTEQEVGRWKSEGYRPWDVYRQNRELRKTLDFIGSDLFSYSNPDLFAPLVSSLVNRDEYLLLADYPSYIERQEEVGEAFMDTNRWTRMSILNVARMGKFSSDRAIREYCEDIWHVHPVEIPSTPWRHSGTEN